VGLDGAGHTMNKRQERAYRILDAAAALILRWGYNKTTIDDIARQAEVAKGTIYLHWKTRDDLFRALIKREQLEMGRDFLEQITQDPMGATIRGIYKHTALALMKRPLLKAFLLGDKDVMGKLAQRERGSAAYAEKLAGFESYLAILRERGLVRTDISPRAQLQVASAIFVGFLFLPPLMPDEYLLTDEETADLIGETVQRALESGRAVSSEDVQSISSAFMQYLDHVWPMLEEQWREELGS
jgi:AcrR family transcriptional regulator